MNTDSTKIRPMTFIRFAVERCIRILIDGDGHVLRPIDNRQVDTVLDPIAYDIGLGPANLSLIETQVNGQTFAMVVESSSNLGVLASSGTESACQIAGGDFGSVWWRVVGFEEGFMDEPLVLATTDCAESAQCTCVSLQALLKPARVAIGIRSGEIVFGSANRHTEVMLLDGDDLAVEFARNANAPVITVNTDAGEELFALLHATERVDAGDPDELWGQLV